MAKESFTDLLPDDPLKSDTKRQKLINVSGCQDVTALIPNWKQQAVSGQGLHRKTIQQT